MNEKTKIQCKYLAMHPFGCKICHMARTDRSSTCKACVKEITDSIKRLDVRLENIETIQARKYEIEKKRAKISKVKSK